MLESFGEFREEFDLVASSFGGRERECRELFQSLHAVQERVNREIIISNPEKPFLSEYEKLIERCTLQGDWDIDRVKEQARVLYILRNVIISLT